MTVYELIQELAKFDPNKEVIFHTHAEFHTEIEATSDVREGQYVYEEVVFDGDCDCMDISEGRHNEHDVVILLEGFNKYSSVGR